MISMHKAFFLVIGITMFNTMFAQVNTFVYLQKINDLKVALKTGKQKEIKNYSDAKEIFSNNYKFLSNNLTVENLENDYFIFAQIFFAHDDNTMLTKSLDGLFASTNKAEIFEDETVQKMMQKVNYPKTKAKNLQDDFIKSINISSKKTFENLLNRNEKIRSKWMYGILIDMPDTLIKKADEILYYGSNDSMKKAFYKKNNLPIANERQIDSLFSEVQTTDKILNAFIFNSIINDSFPSFKKAGNFNYVAVFQHLGSVEEAELWFPIVLKLVEKGEVYPYHLATMIDYKYLLENGTHKFGVLKEPIPEEIFEINNNRIKIGLPTLK